MPRVAGECWVPYLGMMTMRNKKNPPEPPGGFSLKGLLTSYLPRESIAGAGLGSKLSSKLKKPPGSGQGAFAWGGGETSPMELWGYYRRWLTRFKMATMN